MHIPVTVAEPLTGTLREVCCTVRDYVSMKQFKKTKMHQTVAPKPLKGQSGATMAQRGQGEAEILGSRGREKPRCTPPPPQAQSGVV